MQAIRAQRAEILSILEAFDEAGDGTVRSDPGGALRARREHAWLSLSLSLRRMWAALCDRLRSWSC